MQFLLRDFYRAIKLYGWSLGTFCTREEKILLTGSVQGKHTDSATFLEGPVVHRGPQLGFVRPRPTLTS